ncbi:MAG: FG-GAP repeat protein [Planctomycetes bacterium]|nr:FG-GAP repeat protein [Planctomycetota bacterium]
MRRASANGQRITWLAAGLAILLATSDARAQCEVAQLVGTGGAGSARISADVAVVGDTQAFGSLGAAYVFRRGPDGPQDWTLEAVLMAPEPDVEDVFGLAVAVSGGVIVVSAHHADAPEFHSGAAYIFRHDSATGQWGYEATLTASDGDMGDIFGWSVSIDGDAVLIGARDDENDGVSQSGSAYVFRYNREASAWVEEAKLTDPDGEQGDLFGVSVSIRGDAALIGAHGNDSPGLDSGAAFVFRYDGASWDLESELNASDADWGDRFGSSVSLGDDRAIVGAYWENSTPKGNDAGSAYIFRYDGVGWIEEQKITASDADPLDWFGASVSISEDADTTLIGAPDDEEQGFESGSAYVFRYTGDTETPWSEVKKLLASDGGPGDHFAGVSMSDGIDYSLKHGGDVILGHVRAPGRLRCRYTHVPCHESASLRNLMINRSNDVLCVKLVLCQITSSGSTVTSIRDGLNKGVRQPPFRFRRSEQDTCHGRSQYRILIFARHRKFSKESWAVVSRTRSAESINERWVEIV